MLTLLKFLAGMFCLVILGFFAVFNAKKQYNAFIQAENSIAQRYDELNNSVLEQPAPPTNAIEVERTVYGMGAYDGEYLHGRTLVLEYRFSGSKSSLIDYYTNLLESAEWVNISKLDNFEYFRPLTASCIRFRFYDEVYYLTIKHDYQEQPFVPVTPSEIVLYLFEGDTTKFVTCP